MKLVEVKKQEQGMRMTNLRNDALGNGKQQSIESTHLASTKILLNSLTYKIVYFIKVY